MTRLIGLLAASSLGAIAALTITTTASAAPVHLGQERFDAGNLSPKELEAKIVASLAIDPTGHHVIDTAQCQPNGDSCATPLMYIPLIQAADPRADVKDFKGMLAVLDRAVITDAPEGEFWMDCLIKVNGKVVTKQKCVSRPFHPRKGFQAPERAWMNPVTNKVFMAEHCANPVGEKIDDCDEIHFMLIAGDEDHTGLAGPDALPADDVCSPALKRPGETEWTTTDLDTCERTTCTYDETARLDLGMAVQDKPRISFRATVSGEYILRVPRFVEHTEDVFMFCVLHADGTQTKPKFIKKTAYASLGWAYIDYADGKLSTESRTKSGWRGTFHPWIESDIRAFKGARPD